jgi:hypothetical protein
LYFLSSETFIFCLSFFFASLLWLFLSLIFIRPYCRKMSEIGLPNFLKLFLTPLVSEFCHVRLCVRWNQLLINTSFSIVLEVLFGKIFALFFFFWHRLF